METFFTVLIILATGFTLYILKDTISEYLNGGKSFLPNEMKSTSYKR